MANELTNQLTTDQFAAMGTQPNVFARIAEEFQRQAARIEALASALATARGDIAAAGRDQAATDIELKQLVERLAALDDYARKGLLAASEGLVSQYITSNQAKNDAARALANSEAAGTRYDELAAELRGLRESTDALFAATSADIEALGARVAALEPKPPPILVDEGPIVIEGSGRVEIDLREREVWPGFRTKDNDYKITELIFRGPGVVRPKPGFAGIRAVNMAGGATLTVEGTPDAPVELHASGDDIGAIDAPSIALLNLEDVLAVADQRATKDRHARPAVVWCPQTKVSALRSVVWGGNSAIYSPLEDAEAEECLLLPRQFAVNGYAWSGGHFIKSIALPMAGGAGGRGVLLERIKGYVTRAVILAYDVGALSDATPAEPGKLYDRWGLDGCGVRVRYGASVEMDETVVSVLAGGILNHGTALMLSHATRSDIWRNDLTAINVAPGSYAGDAARRDEAPAHPRHFRARPISFESIGTADAPAELSIRANAFAGNQYLVSTTGTDTADPTNASGLVGNFWNWREGATAIDLFVALLDERAQRIERPWWQRCGVAREIQAATEAARALLGDAPLWPLRATWSTGVGGARERLELEENVAVGKAVIWKSGEPGFCSPGGVNPDRALIVDGVRQPAGG